MNSVVNSICDQYQKYHIFGTKMKLEQFIFRGMNISLIDVQKYLTNAYIITLAKTEKVFQNALPSYCNNPIVHNIEQIPNLAPTLIQYWEMLHVYPEDVNSDGEPTDEFFEMVNDNFFLSSGVYHMRRVKHQPLYFYHINTNTHKPEHLSIPVARLHFAKMYERHVNNTACKRLLSILKDSIGAKQVIVRGFSCGNKCFHNAEDFVNTVVNDPSEKFGFEYCLAEILVNFPQLDRCWWNNATISNNRIVYHETNMKYISKNGIYHVDDTRSSTMKHNHELHSESSSTSSNEDDNNNKLHSCYECNDKYSLEYNILD